MQQYSPHSFFFLIAIPMWCVWFLISSFVQGFSVLNFCCSLVFLLFYFLYQCQLFFYRCVLPQIKCICQELDEEPALLTEEYIICMLTSIVYINEQRPHNIYVTSNNNVFIFKNNYFKCLPEYLEIHISLIYPDIPHKKRYLKT